MEVKDEKLKTMRDACLVNAEALLSTAERELEKGVDHICFHLALLALEEIGKSILITISTTVAVAGQQRPGLAIAMDDHIKKIFWAVWGGFFRGDTFTKDEIEKSRDLAGGLHDHRLFYLYTDPNNPLSPEEKMKEGEAKRLIDFVRLRLEAEKITELREVAPEDAATLSWFFAACEDVEKRKQIFSKPSIDKLTELKETSKWIEWLKGVYEENEKQMRKLGEQEMARKKPAGEDAAKPKFKMRVRLQSPSHTIKNNAFDKWNAGVNDIKMRRSDRKGVAETTKSEMILEFTFPKSLSLAGLWEHGFFMSKTLAIAFNVATRGVFWWNVPKDLEKYYEEIEDVESDPKGSVKIKITAGKRLAINWEEVHLALDQEEVSRVSMVAGYLMRYGKKLEDCLNAYSTAMALLSKIDIHLRMEVSAFDQFWKALKAALIYFGDWDGNGDAKEAAKKQFEQYGELKDTDNILDLAASIDLDEKHQRIHPITLTEVIAMKMYCDIYLIAKIAGFFKTHKAGDLEEEGEQAASVL